MWWYFFKECSGYTRTVVRYYIFSKIGSYVERVTRRFEFTIFLCSEALGYEILSIFVEAFWIETVPYNQAVDLNILSNFCIEYFLVWRYLGVQIVGTDGSHVSICAN